MLKKTTNIILAVLFTFIFLLCGCVQNNDTVNNNDGATPDRYSIVYGEDSTYIVLSDEFKAAIEENLNSGSISGCMVDPALKFASAKAMKDAFINKTISDDELKNLATRVGVRENGSFGSWQCTITIPDLNNLYELKAPNNVKIGEVAWRGSNGYSFDIDSAGEKTSIQGSCYIFLNEGALEDSDFFKQVYLEPVIEENITTIKQIEDKNATEIYFHYSFTNDESKIVKYTVTDGEKEFFVIEKYNSPIDEKYVPDHVQIISENKNAYFYVGIYGMGLKPNKNWITEFELIKVE